MWLWLDPLDCHKDDDKFTATGIRKWTLVGPFDPISSQLGRPQC